MFLESECPTEGLQQEPTQLSPVRGALSSFYHNYKSVFFMSHFPWILNIFAYKSLDFRTILMFFSTSIEPKIYLYLMDSFFFDFLKSYESESFIFGVYDARGHDLPPSLKNVQWMGHEKKHSYIIQPRSSKIWSQSVGYLLTSDALKSESRAEQLQYPAVEVSWGSPVEGVD